MKTKFSLVLFSSFVLMNAPAQAASPDITIANTTLAALSNVANATILPQALIWLGSFMALQFVITQIGQLKSGAEIEAIFGKLIGSLMWFSVCIYILNNGPEFIHSVGTGILAKYTPPGIFSPGYIIAATLSICTIILGGIVVLGTSIAGVGNSSIAMVLVYALFTVFGVGMYMAIKIFMLTLELGLIVMLSPLSFSFLGLNALKDQGIAPFKSLISLVYRIILLGIICSAFAKVLIVMQENLMALSWKNILDIGSSVSIVLSALCAFPMLAYLAYKSDSIAASLAGGSTSMGPGDVAGAAAAGAAAGALAAGAPAAMANGGKSMGDVIKNMLSKGSISDASTGKGVGGATTPISPAPVANMSTAKPVSPTNDNGVPMQNTAKPDGPSPAEMAAGGGGAGDTSSSSGDSAPTPAQTAAGSGATAAIGGAGNKLEETLAQLAGHLEKQGAQRKTSFGDRLEKANQHVAQEKAATSVSISTHHSD